MAEPWYGGHPVTRGVTKGVQPSRNEATKGQVEGHDKGRRKQASKRETDTPHPVVWTWWRAEWVFIVGTGHEDTRRR
jgi:hypothetical protein